MSFQALEFYQKMGFELDFTRPGYAHGTSFHYLSKKLISQAHCNIRPLRQQDIEVLGDLYFPWSTREETVTKWTRYLDEQQKGTRTACIIEQQDKIVGYGHLLLVSEYPPFKKNGIPEIHDVWIFEEERHKGFGSMLIRHLEQLAKKNECQKIGIGVGLYRDYGPAQKLYFQMGYCPNGEGISYQCNSVVPGEKYPADDDLILWLLKQL